MKAYNNITELIGNTPILRLNNLEKNENLKAKVFAKLEYFNPGGSVKDRVALNLIKDAERRGVLKKGSSIIEPTSGNTGIGIALVAAARGYRAIIVMPENMSIERVKLISAYGAEIVLTKAALGMAGAVAKAEELAKQTEGSIVGGQFSNPANPEIHYMTTGPELWNDTEGQIDIFVAGVGTGGTISGAGKFLKEKNPDIKIVAVEPKASPLLSGGEAGPHKIQGIGANFVPETLDRKIYDEILPVSNEDALSGVKLLSNNEGVFVGISSGAALHAAVEIANRPENSGKNIIVLLPDTGERYLSTL